MKFLVVILAFIGSSVFGDETIGGLANSRVIGGSPVPIENRPYIASVLHDGVHRCGGTIVNDHCILTSAQCTFGIPDAVLSVRVGSTASQSGGHLFQVDYVDNHHNFNPNTFANDLSVIHVVGHLHFSSTVQAIAMPALGQGVPAGAIATVTGWGSITEGGAFSPVLQSVDIPVITNAVCNQNYGGRITDGMICAGFNGAGACSGDYGGPLTFGNQVVGIVSWGEGCGRPNLPAVHTRIAYYRQWIDEHTHDHH